MSDISSPKDGKSFKSAVSRIVKEVETNNTSKPVNLYVVGVGGDDAPIARRYGLDRALKVALEEEEESCALICRMGYMFQIEWQKYSFPTEQAAELARDAIYFAENAIVGGRDAQYDCGLAVVFENELENLTTDDKDAAGFDYGSDEEESDNDESVEESDNEKIMDKEIAVAVDDSKESHK